MNSIILSKLKNLKSPKDVENFVQSSSNAIILLEAIKRLVFPKNFNIKNISCKALQTIFSYKGLEKFTKNENVLKLIKANGFLKCMQPYITAKDPHKDLPDAITVFQKIFGKDYNMVSLFAEKYPLEIKKIIPLMVKRDFKYHYLTFYEGLCPVILKVETNGYVTIEKNNIELRGHGHSNSKQSIDIELFVPIPTYIEFDVTIGSEPCCDHARFYINGRQINKWSGHSTKHYKYDLPHGNIKLRFTYSKDCCDSYYFDGVDFKNITIGESKWPLIIE